jgi:hypothetical protein
LIFSSSHHEIRYIIPLSINAITAKTATYCIIFQIKLVITSIPKFCVVEAGVGLAIFLSTHHGNQIQFTFGNFD